MKRKVTIARSIKVLLIGIFTSGLMTVSQQSSAQNFTPGNIAVALVASNASSNTTASIVELAPATANQTPSHVINVSGTGANAIRVSGSTAGTVLLSNSNDNTRIAFGGYNSATTSGNCNALNPRAAVTFDWQSTFALASTYTGTSGKNYRAVSTVDNTTWYFAEQSGVWTSGGSVVTISGNFNGMKAYGGTMYAYSNSTPFIGTISGSAFTGFTFDVIPTSTNLLDFCLASSADNGVYDILYLSNASSATAGTINKYSLVNGTWTSNGSYTTAFGGYSIAARKGTGNTEDIFVSTGVGSTAPNSVIKMTDAAGINSTINITTGSNVTLYTTTGAISIKGVAFAPLQGVITVSSTNLTGYSYTSGSGPSTPAQIFNVSATGISSGTVALTAPADYEISTDGTNFFSSLPPITPSAGVITSTPISVRLKAGLSIGNYNNESIAIRSSAGVAVTVGVLNSGTVLSAIPTVTVSTGSLSLYTQQGGTPQYLEGTYTVSGINLTNDVIITPPTGVEIGLSSGSETGSPITLTQSSGTVATTTIYVRIAASASVGAFAAANIGNASTGAATQNVAVSGTVFAAAAPFTTGNVVIERTQPGIAFLDEYTTGGSLVQSIPLPFNNTSPFFVGTSSSEGLDALSVDGQYIIATGYSTTATDAPLPAAAPRKFARIKYDGTIDNSTSMNDATATGGNMRNAASVDGSGFWLASNNGSNNNDIYQTFGATSGESFFQGTVLGTPVAPLINTRGMGIFDGSIYTTVGSSVYQVPGTPTSNGAAAVQLTGIPSGGEGTKSLGFVLFDVDPSIPGPDVLYIADLGSNFAANAAYSTNTAGTFGVFKYVNNGTTWVNKGKVIGPASAITGQVTGNDVVLYAVVNCTSTTDTLYKITDAGAGNAATYTGNISNNGITFKNVAASYVAASASGTDFEGVTFAPVQAGAAPSVTITTGASVSQNLPYGSNKNLLYQFSMVNNSGTTPAYLTSVTLTPGGTYSTSNLNAFTLYYSTSSTFDAKAFQVGSVAPAASGTAFTINTGLSIPVSATGYFYVCTNVASTGNGNTVIINAPVDGNFTFADGGSATGGAYTGGGINTIVPAQQVAASVSSIIGLYTTVGTASPSQNFNVSGSGLIANETVTLTAGTNVEISTDNATWINSTNGNTITLTQVGGVVAATPIYVRIRTSAPAGAVSDNITLASTNANNVVVTVTGYVGKPFTSGNIVVSRTGSGSAGLTSAATQVFMDEYTTAGSLVQSIPLPVVANGANKICTQSGSASTVGLDHLSLDGQFYLSTGYNSIVGATSVTGQHNSSNGGIRDEVVASVKYDGTINTTTTITNMYDANLIRSAASIDGTSFWVSGRSNNAGGTLPQATDGGPGYVTLGGSTATQLSPSVLNVESRNINIITSQLYCSAPAPYQGINAIGLGVNNNSGQAISKLVSDTINPWGYVAFDTDTTAQGIDIIYVADQSRGVFKYTQDAVGNWTYRGKLTGSANGISGKVVGGNIVLYVVSGARGTRNTVYSITDPVGHANMAGNGTAITATGTLLITAPLNTTFSSLDFAPVALGGTPSVAVAAPAPAAGGVLPGSTGNVLYQLNGTASVAKAIVTGVTLTTAGTYVPSDFASNSFNFYYSNANVFDTTAVQIGTAAVAASGGTVTFNIAQPIPVGTTMHFFLTGDAAASPVIGHTINITATVLSNIHVADAGTVTGTAAAGGVQTFDACAGSGGTAWASGGTALNTNTVICSGTAATVGLHNYFGSIQWQFSADGQTGWTAVTGGSGQGTSTLTTPVLTTGTYFRAYVTNSCFLVSSNTVFVGISAAPAITLTNFTPTTVSAAWTPFAGNTNVSYKLTYSGAGTGTINPVLNNPQTISGLTPGTLLNVTIQQLTPAGCSVSNTASINTLCAAPVLSLSSTTTTVTASWTGSATQYKLFYKDPGYSTFSSIIVTGNSHVFTNLRPNNVLLIYVAPFNCPNTGELGAQSTEQLVYTQPNTTTCAVPTVTAVSNCPNQITIGLSGSSTGTYKLVFTRVAPNPSAGVAYNITGTLVNLNVGIQNAASTWQVFAYSDCGGGVLSQVSTPFYVVVKPSCNQLQNLVLSTPSCVGFEATWNADNCNGSLATYYLYIRKHGTTGFNAYPTSTNNFFHVGWIASGTWDAYVASAACNISLSAPSPIQTIATGVGCRDEEDNNVASDTQLSDNTNAANTSMTVYPNPTAGNFMVNVYEKAGSDETIKIEMTNNIGQVVYTLITPVANGISNNLIQLPAEIASGMYFIHTIANGENLSKQLMYTK